MISILKFLWNKFQVCIPLVMHANLCFPTCVTIHIVYILFFWFANQEKTMLHNLCYFDFRWGGVSDNKDLPVLQETWVQSLVLGDPLEKGMATHSRVLAWIILWTKDDYFNFLSFRIIFSCLLLPFFSCNTWVLLVYISTLFILYIHD